MAESTLLTANSIEPSVTCARAGVKARPSDNRPGRRGGRAHTGRLAGGGADLVNLVGLLEELGLALAAVRLEAHEGAGVVVAGGAAAALPSLPKSKSRRAAPGRAAARSAAAQALSPRVHKGMRTQI